MTERKAVAFNGKIFCDAPNHLLDEWDGEISSPILEKNAI